MRVSQTCTNRHLVSTTADMLLSSVEDLYRQTSRTKLIGKLVLDRKELIFQHLQDYTAERARQINEGLAAEAVRMRMITIDSHLSSCNLHLRKYSVRSLLSAILTQSRDFLQHRHHQVSESIRQQRRSPEQFLLSACLEEMVAGHPSADGTSNHYCVVHVQGR
jgi:hypothetical protein